jgi:adenylate cyclase
MAWLKNTNDGPAVIAFLRRARRSLPGDPEFGVRCRWTVLADRARPPGSLIGCWSVRPPHAKLAWERCRYGRRVSGKPPNREVTLVFTDLAKQDGVPGDLAMLRLTTRRLLPGCEGDDRDMPRA